MVPEYMIIGTLKFIFSCSKKSTASANVPRVYEIPSASASTKLPGLRKPAAR